MPEVVIEEASRTDTDIERTDTDIEQFAFTPILDDHDADVSEKDAAVLCFIGCS
jgi:hypothetical protein